ncbi:PspC domain-containing protein [Thermococcus sp.]|jgi:phage shock protein PspC (stress-responsive transcriptional regulator)|uniref:PspC domain-containing protein n=1 Tax=Thermococcus sp. TaxID=35749 RepID=UPI002605C7C8|nr:PspC domain-containing protein [Thermococcus sp.]
MERKLRRSSKNRVLLGVLGGIAEYLGTDPVLVRLGYLLLFIFHPVAMTVFYFLAAVIMPSEGEEDEDVEKRAERIVGEVKEIVTPDSEEEKLAGIILLVLGALLLVETVAPTSIGVRTVLALALLGLGSLLLLRGEGR